MRLWLDDMRPAPTEGGWRWVKTVDEAKEVLTLEAGNVMEASFDHDLGACAECMKGYEDAEDWLEKHEYKSMPNCKHFGTGYDLLCWLEEFPQYKPTTRVKIHTANPVGRKRMQMVVEKLYG